MDKIHLKIAILSILTLFQTSCNTTNKKSNPEVVEKEQVQNNMLTTISSDNLGDFKWFNKPQSFEIKDGILHVIAEKETDFFNNPEDGKKIATAPLLYNEVDGDFVAKVLVRPDFSSLWNAVALMVHMDNDNWIKFAFENSDATGKSIVTVVTKNLSDDTNGVILNDQDAVWLKMVRKNNIFSMLWSKNGKDFKMARLTTMKKVDSVKIGLEFQSPVGESATHYVDYFGIEKTTVKNLRKGE